MEARQVFVEKRIVSIGPDAIKVIQHTKDKHLGNKPTQKLVWVEKCLRDEALLGSRS